MPDNEIRDRCLELLARAEHDRFGSDDDDHVQEPWESIPEGERDSWRRIATPWVDALLAAGWRPPPRVIEHWAETATLPDNTIVADSGGSAWQHELGADPTKTTRWRRLGKSRPDAPDRMPHPITVLWQPEETETDA